LSVAWPVIASHGNHCYINSKIGDIHRPHNSTTPGYAMSIVRPTQILPLIYLPHPLTTLHCTAPPPTTCLTIGPTSPESGRLPYKYHHSRLLLPYFTFLPMKMEPIEVSETSAFINQTPGNYPKGNLL